MLIFSFKAATTSPEPQKQKIEGYLKRWKDARFPMHAAIFVDIVGPLRVLSLGLQADENDPVKALRRIKEFHWTMVKLQSSDFATAKFDKFNENCEPVHDQHVYQNVPLSNFPQALNGAEDQRREWIEAIVKCMENRFKDLKEAPVYKHLCPILDTQSWPTEESQLIAHGDESVMKLVQHFTALLQKTRCDVSKDTMLTEWSSLKLLISESYGKAVPYLDVWAAIFSLPAHSSKFSNILNIIELLLITPVSNAIVERMFSTMARMKPKLHNRMSRDKLDSLLRISEEGPQVKDYDPTAAIDHWYGQKKRRIGFGGHEYPKNRKNKRTEDDRHAYFSDQESESD